MVITYEVGNGLYVNVTNRCSNACDFCVRQTADGYYGELWLEREPSVNEITEDILNRELSRYSEIVFCGYGEPTVRLDDVLEVAKNVKKSSAVPIRINTNGHACLIHGYDVTPRFSGLIDAVSVSLNTANALDYDKVCHSEFGQAAYAGLLDFTERIKKYVPEVALSVVRGSIPDEDIEKCRAIADSLGVKLKVREFISG
jgi:TatD family-associated radical SAM protein